MLKLVATYTFWGPLIGTLATVIMMPMFWLILLIPALWIPALKLGYMIGIVPALLTGLYAAWVYSRRRALNLPIYLLICVTSTYVMLLLLDYNYICIELAGFSLLQCGENTDFSSFPTAVLFLISSSLSACIMQEYVLARVLNLSIVSQRKGA